jgi:hypothetical protein
LESVLRSKHKPSFYSLGISRFFVLFVVLLFGVGPKSYSRRLARHATIWQLRRQTKRIQPIPQKVILSPDEVVEKRLDLRGKFEVVLGWQVFNSIELGEQHAFFFTQNNAGLIVPQRAFPDGRAFLDFVETAWTYHQRAREIAPQTEPASPSLPEKDRPDHRITARSENRSAP